MTNHLRDEIAIKALTILLEDDLKKPINKQAGPQWAVEESYVIADLMLKERERASTESN